jgi:hypothetical protein
MAKEIIYDVETGETIERDETAEQISLRQAILDKYLADTAQREALQAETDAAKAIAQAKLAALGLTTDDLKALGLGGN